MPSERDFQFLAETTKFTPDEINLLWEKFKTVSNSMVKDYLIDINEFRKAMALRSNEFTQRIFAAFDADGSRRIDFMEFVTGLYALSSRATISDKAKFCFAVYDIDKNGFIEKNGLFMVPRIWSASICYRAAQREVVLFLGAPFLEPPNLGLVHVGDAISILHQRMDMLDVIK